MVVKLARGERKVDRATVKREVRLRDPNPWEDRLSKLYEVFELITNYITTRISAKEIIVFFDALSLAFSQGMPIISSVKAVAASSSPKLSRALENIAAYLSHGSSLYSAIARFPWIFDPVTVKLVQIGEYTGNLASQLQLASRYVEEKEKLRARITSALQYPALLALMMILIFGIFVKFVFPVVKQIAKPEGITVYFFALAEFLGKLLTPSFLLALGIAFISFYIASLLLLRLEPEWITVLKYKVPFLGDVLLKYDLIVLFFSLESLYRSGASLNTGLRILGSRFKGPIGVFIRDLEEALVRGDTIGGVFEKYERRLIPSYVVAMVKVGEESGHMGDSLSYVVNILRSDVEMKVRTLVTLLEPILMIGMGFLVLFIFLSLLPVFLKFYRGDFSSFTL